MRALETPHVEHFAVAASAGDMDALGELYEHYYDQVLRFIALRTQNNVALAEDIAATVWWRVSRGISEYQSRKEGFTAWLFAIVRNSVAEHFRFARRRPEDLDGDMLAFDRADPGTGPLEALEQRIQAEEIAAAVRGLSAAQRECVTLRFFVGLSLSETASVMGKNVNSVKQLQHRALTVLKKRLGGVFQVEPVSGTIVTVGELRDGDRTQLAGGSAV